jgi:chloride channel protein, CIC family
MGLELDTLRKVTRMPAVWRLRVLQGLARFGVREETLLILLAVVIGLASAGAAWLFETLLALIRQNYYQKIAVGRLTHGYWILLLPLLPAGGGLALSGVRWLFHSAHSKLHGLSNVLLSLVRNTGKLPTRMGLETLFASSMTIATGGSAGPEAPIAIVGSSVGSIIGDMAGISRRNLPTLIGCGAAAGISAVFDAPIAGVLFAMEVMLRDFSVRTFTPIVISAVIATTAFHNFHTPAANEHVHGLFALPTHLNFTFTFKEMPFYALLGILCGLTSVFFTWQMEFSGKCFERMKIVPPLLRPALGAFLSGVLGIILLWLFKGNALVQDSFAARAYVPIFDDGYYTVKQAIDPTSFGGGAIQLTLGFMLACFFFKIAATGLTLGSGGSGGVFAPTIFVGAAGGAVLGLALRHFMPDVQPSAYAIIGMGTVLAAVSQAPLMGIILLFELTREYQVMLPIMLSAVVATIIHQLILGDSIYTRPIRAMGIRLGSAVGVSALRRIGVDQMELEPVPVVRPNDTLSDVLSRGQKTGIADWVVLDGQDRYLGLLTIDDLKVVMLEPESAPLLLVGEVFRSDVPPLKPSDTLDTALEGFARHAVTHMAVVDGKGSNVLGVLDREVLLRRYHQELSR